MRLKLQNGLVVTLTPFPKRRRPNKSDPLEGSLSRWMYLTADERRALMEKMKACRRGSWARSRYLPWAGANLKLWTLPCEAVTVLSDSPEEDDALRAYWDGWMEQSERVWNLRWKWPALSSSERAGALILAEIMAADLPIARGLRDWMKQHLDDSMSASPAAHGKG